MIEAGSELRQATPWLAGIVCAVQSPFAGATRRLGLGCLVLIDKQQQGEKSGVLQKGVAHWNGLKSW
jgi:hypothetical protein